jgi:hypothetical protein
LTKQTNYGTIEIEEMIQMPNWCDNTVEVVGDKEVLETILEKAKDENQPFSFQKLVPQPEELNDTKHFGSKTSEKEGEFENALLGNREFAYTDWYNWRLGNWGTKWDLDFDTTQVSKIVPTTDGKQFKFEIGYSTAWAPALQFWQTLSEQYPIRVKNLYAEEGIGFLGRAFIENGEMDDECLDITPEIYKSLGVPIAEDGCVDWDNADEYDLYDYFKEEN